MVKYNLRGEWLSPDELSIKSGIAAPTIRDRLRRGYSVEEAVKVTATHDSVKEFCAASYYQDWIGMPISYLHEIYWNWCIEHGYTPIHIQGFSRQLMGMYPMLKTVPTKRGDKYHRIIRSRVKIEE